MKFGETMTPVFGSLLFFGVFITLVIAILKLTDGSYLISGPTRPTRLKHRSTNTYEAENGKPSDPKVQRVYRQSSTREHVSEPRGLYGQQNIFHKNVNQIDEKIGLQKTWSFDKRSNFFRALKPAARHFMLNRPHEPAISRGKRNQYDDFYDEDLFPRPDLSDMEENVIEENPKLSKNLNYYPYRGKRPFEVPQIGE